MKDRLAVALMLESDAPGGAECMLLLLAEQLRARGHSVCPVGPNIGSGWLAAEFRKKDFVPETYSLRRMLDLGCVRQLAGLLRRRKIDIVHSHEFTMALYGAAASKAARIPQVVTMHSARGATGTWRRRVALRWALRQTASVVAVSNATRVQLTTALGLSNDAVGVVHNGVRFQPGKPDRIRQELGIGPDEVLILAVGNLYPVKGHIVLLRALAGLHARRADVCWHLAIAGKVSLRGKVEDQAKHFREYAETQGFSNRLYLLGYRADVPDLLAAADIYVMPSLSEGLPLALLEAMHAGKPIVASDVGGIPEVLRARSEGLLVPPGDDRELGAALMRFILSPHDRAVFGAAAKRRAAQAFGAHTMADQYERLYFGAIQAS